MCHWRDSFSAYIGIEVCAVVFYIVYRKRKIEVPFWKSGVGFFHFNFLLSPLALELPLVDPLVIRGGFAVHCPQCLAGCSAHLEALSRETGSCWESARTAVTQHGPVSSITKRAHCRWGKCPGPQAPSPILPYVHSTRVPTSSSHSPAPHSPIPPTPQGGQVLAPPAAQWECCFPKN